MKVPFSIQSAEIFQVGKGNFSGVAAVRLKLFQLENSLFAATPTSTGTFQRRFLKQASPAQWDPGTSVRENR